jgi:hypothetical protein
LNARSALLGLFVALTIVLASTTVYEAGTRTTPTSTSTSTSTKTSTLFSSVLGNTALVTNSSLGLGLSLQVEPGLNGSYTFMVRESNLLDSVNNVTGAISWNSSQDSLAPWGAVLYSNVVILAVVQGHYGENNYTSEKALPLYTPAVYTCAYMSYGGGHPFVYQFQPQSDLFSQNNDSNPPEYIGASASITASGYWTLGQNGDATAFKPFPPGVYTVIGADEWGDVVLLPAFLE